MSTLNKPSAGAYQVGPNAGGGPIYASGHHQV